jgi:hypothetical protein
MRQVLAAFLRHVVVGLALHHLRDAVNDDVQEAADE